MILLMAWVVDIIYVQVETQEINKSVDLWVNPRSA